MRNLVLFMLVLLIPSTAMARCAPFDFFKSIDSIPFIIHGKVTQSNKEDLLSRQCNPEVCEHQFVIQVIQVLKGDTNEKELVFKYDFVNQRPGIILFSERTEYVFAVSNVTTDGQATLFGNTCGRSGLSTAYLDEIKKALK
jgi:hypothetical protein